MFGMFRFQRSAMRKLTNITRLPQERTLHKSDDIILHSVTDHNVEKTPITAQLWQMRADEFAKDHIIPSNNDHAAHLLQKSAEQSKLTLQYNFRKDVMLRDMYVDHLGHVLVGKLFEDLDALAGNIAHKHCDDGNANTKRLSLVTASVDKIVQAKPISISQDLLLSGQVVWVGRSSLDVLIELHSIPPSSSSDQPIVVNDSTRVLSSFFTYVAKNKDSDKPALVNKLTLITPEQTALFQQRQTIADCRKAKSSPYDLYKDEVVLAAQLVEAGSAVEDMPALAHSNSVLMRSTALENSLICQPQNVNTSGRVFGGLIMNRAYDLALATCYTFAGSYPVFQEIDRIAFRRPVDVGDLLRLKSRVIFTSDDPVHPMVVIEVNVQVVRPERASSFVSNTFNFVFGFDKKVQVALRKVLPVTNEEAAMLIYGSKLQKSAVSHRQQQQQ